MSYFPQLSSDTTASSVLSPTSLTLAGNPTQALDTAGYKYVDFIINVENPGTSSQIILAFQGTELEEPDASFPSSDWYNTIDLAKDENTPGRYAASNETIVINAPTPGKYAFTTRVRGVRMRAVVVGDKNDNDSTFSVSATRRV